MNDSELQHFFVSAGHALAYFTELQLAIARQLDKFDVNEDLKKRQKLLSESMVIASGQFCSSSILDEFPVLNQLLKKSKSF